MSHRKNLEKAIKSIAGERMTDFEESIHSMMATKLLDAFEKRRPIVSTKLFGEANSTEEI